MANFPSEGETPHPVTDDEKAELLRQFHDDSKEHSTDPVANEYADVESLTQDVKAEAIAIAREILEKLKIVYEDISLLDLITITDGDILDDFSEDIHDLEALFAYQVDQALHIDPTLANDPEVALASDALGMMGAVTRAYAKKKSGQITDEMLSLMAQKEIQNAEQRNQQLKGKTVDKLAEDIERGLNKVQEKTRDAQQQMTPENLDIRLERGLESRGMSPERSQQQQLQQQQRQQQLQQGQQTMQAQQLVQSMRQVNQGQQGQQLSSQQQTQAKRAAGSGMVQDVVRRRLQQQLRNQNQMGQQGQGQQAAQRQQQQQTMQVQQMQQAWRAQQQILRRAMQRQQQRLQEMTRIRATQKNMSAHHDEDHHDHGHDHGEHQPPKGLVQKSMQSLFKPIAGKGEASKGDLSKLLAGADLSALKHNLSTVDAGQSVVGPRTAKDTIREIQSTQNGQRPDDLPPPPPKKGPLVGM